MLRIYLSTILIFIFSLVSLSQEVIWSSDTVKTTDFNTTTASIVSGNNLFVIGEFQGNSTFGNNIFTSYNNSRDVFISKYDKNTGKLDTATQIGSNGTEKVYHAHIYNNYLYVIGVFNDDCNFSNTETLINTGLFDGYVAKYTMDLDLVWAKSLAYNPDIQRTTDMFIDNENNIVISGDFKNSVTFAHSVSPVTITPTQTGRASFIAKFDLNGDYISSVINEGTNNIYNWNTDLVGDDVSYYTINRYRSDVYLDGNQLTSTGSDDGVLIKYDYNFNLKWYREVKGTSSDVIYNLNIDDNSNLYLSGAYQSNDLVLDSTATTQTQNSPSVFTQDIFVCKYDSSGTLFWHKYAIGNSSNVVNFSDNNQEVLYVSGNYSDDLDYDGTTIPNLTSSIDAIYMSVNMTDGSLIDFFSIGNEGDEEGNSVSLDIDILNNQFYISGSFTSDSLFVGNDTLVNSDINTNKTDMFVVKYGCRGDIYPTFTIDTITCPGSSDGSASVYITNGTDTIADNWTYLWSNADTDSLIENISEGTYTVTITSPKGCAYTDSVFVTNYPVLQTTLADTLTLDCEASDNGMAIVTPSLGYQGTTGYQYLWDNGESDSTAMQLTIGIHYVTVQDACGATTEVIDTINIGHLPTLQAHIQTQNVIVLCDTSSNGIGRVDYTDGKAPYSFYWENSNTDTTSAVANDLTVGWHTVTITDFCNVPIIDSVNIVNMPSLSTQITYSQNATCIGNLDGVATISPFNGVEPFIYAWSASVSDTTSASDLPGDSMIYVTVSDICREVVDSVYIEINPAMEISFDNVLNTSCTNSNNGNAEVILTNEQGTIIYLWSNDSTTAINNALDSGYAYITVTDLCGALVDSVLIGINPALEISFTNITNTNCSNSNDGGAEVTLTNEQGTVSYLWSNDSTTAINTALPAGYAIVSVTDICGQLVDSVEILTELPLAAGTVSTDNTCYGDSLGTATISTLNEYGIVLYAWNTGDTTAVIDSLASGTYYYTVTDECLDVISDSVTIESPTAITDTVIIVNETLYGNADGSATLTVSGGTTPYIIEWSNNDIGNTAEYLTAGTYTYVIRDANNCELSDSVVIIADEYEVVVYNAFTPNADGVNDVWNIKYIDNFPDATVQIFNQWGAEVFSSTDGYSEPWDGTMDGSELPAGTYYYIIRLGDDYKDKSGSVTIIK